MKKWKIKMSNRLYSIPIEFVEEMGDKSNKQDVVEKIKREGITGEILDISEVIK